MDITVMDNLTPSDLPPQSGWIAALLLTLGGLLKGAWPYLKSKSAEQAKLTASERAAQREEERDLVLTLKETVGKHESKIDQLEKRLDAALQLITTLTSDKAELTAKLAHANAENDRIRGERDHYRSIAQTGAEALAVSRPDAAKQVLEEISEADEATSQAGKVGP